LVDPALWRSNREEQDDASHDRHCASNYPAADLLVGEPNPEWQRNDKAQSRDCLYSHQGTQIKCHRLQDPSGDLEEHPSQPHRFAKYLNQPRRVSTVVASFERPLLLKHGAESESNGGDERKSRSH
jgi:hypothetical protein